VAWTSPLTAVANASLTAAQWNASVRDNLAETAPAKATTQGSHFIASGANGIAERMTASGVVGTSESTSSTSFVALTTAGPSATVTTFGRGIAMFGCEVTNNTAGSRSVMSFAVSGATTVAATAASSITFSAPTAAYIVQCSRVIMQTLTAGSNVFTAQYAVNSGSGTFGQRTMIVFPL